MRSYLDYNATAPVRPEVTEAMSEWLGVPANPSSVHAFGRAAKKALEDARASIASHLNCFANEIVFTASGTEANALALNIPSRRILVSAVEHASVLKNPRREAVIAVDANGIIDLAALESLLQNQSPALVSVMLANNETGVIQPIREIAALCKKHNALLHCDAVQALGKIPLDYSSLGADMLTISAHKCGGPLGAAALIVRNNLPITPLLVGGGQELGRRAGTENIPAIVGFAKAIEMIDLSAMNQVRNWLNVFEKACEILGGVVNGKGAGRLPNTSSITMPGVSAEVQLMNFDIAGFAVSAGSACSSGRIEPSHVLRAMGQTEADAACAIRVSAGWATKEAEIMAFSELWSKTCLQLSRKGDMQTSPKIAANS